MCENFNSSTNRLELEYSPVFLADFFVFFSDVGFLADFFSGVVPSSRSLDLRLRGERFPVSGKFS